jgi:hypothetical protein
MNLDDGERTSSADEAALERHRMVERLRAQLLRRESPRFEMTVLVMGAGLAGFAISAALLALGMSSMALRYPLAVLGGWLVFLALVWAWVEYHGRRAKRRLDASDGLPNGGTGATTSGSDESFIGHGGEFGGGGASAGWDGPSPGAGVVESTSSALDVDLDDGVVVLLPLLIAAGAVAGVFYVVYVAPALLAEMLLDVLLVSGLYRSLRHAEPRSYLPTAVRRTSLPVAAAAVTAGVAGWAMQAIEPTAFSIGAFVRTLS